MGLLYGDLLSFRQTFPNMPVNQIQTSGEGKKNYGERAGFDKKIDIHFEERNFPKVSICGLNVSLPIQNMTEKLRIATVFGAGFGCV